jgi:hypothetical protein
VREPASTIVISIGTELRHDKMGRDPKRPFSAELI